MRHTMPRGSPREPPVILVIDPDTLNRDVATTILRYAGFRVLEAEDAEVGVQMARRCKPAIIVTELFERTQEGWDILETFASDEETTNIPVVVFSAYALASDRAAALHAGVARFLTKPLPPQELEEVIEELLEIVGPIGPEQP